MRTHARLLSPLWIAVFALPGFALSDPDDFCTGDPCQITSAKTADADIILDFGSRDVILTDILTIGDLPSGEVGSLLITAGSFSIIGDGQIKGNGGSGQAGEIDIDVTGDIRVDGTRATGAFRLPGNDGGNIGLFAGGNVFGGGKFNIDRDSTIGSGGELLINAGGYVDLSGDILARGGLQGFGGTIDIQSGGDITLAGLTQISGGDSGGGSLDLFADGSITLGEIDMSAGGDAGDAGLGDIFALGDIDFNGPIAGSGADNGEDCGDAGDLDITADGDIAVNADFTFRGRGLDCSGGFLSVDGDAIDINAELDLSATGSEGIGGDIDLSSISPMHLDADLRVDGPDGAGDILILSDTDIFANADILANGRGTFGIGSSLVELDASFDLHLAGSIDVSGGGQGGGGDIDLAACQIIQGAASTLNATAAGGVIGLVASDLMSLSGTFIGEPTSPTPIEIVYGIPADPPDIASATFNVAPTLVLSPLLIPCSLCDDVDCDDSNPCTNDSCDPFVGCVYTANNNPCDDGDACTTRDICAFSLCVGFDPLTCDDGEVCTDDFCDPASGCQATANTDPCDDGDACTESDACSAGTCSGSPIDCEDGNPCTDNSCSAGVCQSVDNTAPCEDGDACTVADTCVGGACQSGAQETCADADPCTTDSCDSGIGCVFDAIPGCFDSDGDGIIDDEDNCTTLDWSTFPRNPPDQHPAKMRFSLKNLAKPAGEQGFLLKGFFNVAEPAMPVQPEIDGVHVALEDSDGIFFEISVPGGAVGDLQNCDPRDGWSVSPGPKTRWKYKNKSGAFPPSCAPGSAQGISKIQLKDLRSTGKAALQAKVKAKRGSVDRSPVVPLTKIQANFALSAQPSPGTASDAAIDGQCAEALITGNPIAGKSPVPFCKAKFRNTVLDKVICKGF